MSTDRACQCAEEGALHAGHCCLDSIDLDGPPRQRLTCGHNDDFIARAEAAEAARKDQS